MNVAAKSSAILTAAAIRRSDLALLYASLSCVLELWRWGSCSTA